MGNRTCIILVLYLLISNLVLAVPGAKIIKLSGDVKVRRGLDEQWQPAYQGMSLEIIDSILALEGEVVLEIEDGVTFTLGTNSMLDISDLRKITRKELFLYLMSEKVGKIPQRDEKAKLRIGNVSVVHGESKSKSSVSEEKSYHQKWQQELNGAKAMFHQEYYPNAVVKLHKIRKNYASMNDFGELHFYLGQSFEELDEEGQAVDAYQIAVDQSKDSQRSSIVTLRKEAQEALERLKK